MADMPSEPRNGQAARLTRAESDIRDLNREMDNGFKELRQDIQNAKSSMLLYVLGAALSLAGGMILLALTISLTRGGG